MGSSKEHRSVLAKHLLTTGLLTRKEVTSARATTDAELVNWILRKGLLPGFILEQARAGKPMRLGRYEITGRIGVGGMGAVMRAQDASLGREVALKVLPPAPDEDDVERFRREAKALAKLNHPHIVRIYSFDEVEETAFFAMQFVDGPSLDDRLSDEGPLEEDEVWRLFDHAAQAMAHAESHGILHRDIKPGNILCERDGERYGYKLCDFGLARFDKSGGTLTRAGYTLGTPSFMSPEQARGDPLDSRSDMYSLGLTLFNALTGVVPFESEDAPMAVVLTRRLRKDVPNVRSERAEVSRDLAKLIAALTEREARRRPKSWDDVLRKVRKLRQRESPLGVSSSGPRSALPFPAGTPNKALAVAVVVLSTLVGLLLSLAMRDDPDPEPLAGGSPTPVPSVAPRESPPPSPDEPPPTIPRLTPTPSPEGARGPIRDSSQYSAALRAAEGGDAEAALRVAAWLEESGRPLQATGWYQRAADAGLPAGLTALGRLLARGEGVARDEARAAEYFRRAARAGHPEGAYELALALRDGLGVEVDLRAARAHAQRAARAGFSPAMGLYATLLSQGKGGPEDPAEAVRWARLAAAQGDALGMYRLGVLLATGAGVAEDSRRAATWFEKSAAAGHAPALTYLGYLYDVGQGVPEDLSRAARLYREAAEAGEPAAMNNYGGFLCTGRGVRRDEREGARWYLAAAQAGHAQGMFNYAEALCQGRGVPRDERAGVAWYRKAAEAGDPKGMYGYATALAKGIGLPRDQAAAMHWFQQAMEAGHKQAELALKALRSIQGDPPPGAGRNNPGARATPPPDPPPGDKPPEFKQDPEWRQVFPERLSQRGLRQEGGGADTEEAVSLALEWLAKHQSGDGRWDGDGWPGTCPEGCLGSRHNTGDVHYDVGLTALSLLVFFGQGHTQHTGPHRRTVARGLDWLIAQQKQRGSLGFSTSHGESIYNHALGTLALCEAYALTGEMRAMGAAQQALNFIVRCQNPAMGWKYGVRTEKNDTSVTGWMVQALWVGQEAGLNVPSSALEGAQRWFVSVTDPVTGAAGYEQAAGGSAFLRQNEGKFAPMPVMTAAAILGRIRAGDRRRASTIKRGARLLLQRLPTVKRNTLNFYYWYYGSYALFQVGPSSFRDWNKALKAALLPSQRREGCERGSWDPLGEWCLAGGRVYATAINALSLEVYYRYPRGN